MRWSGVVLCDTKAASRYATTPLQAIEVQLLRHTNGCFLKRKRNMDGHVAEAAKRAKTAVLCSGVLASAQLQIFSILHNYVPVLGVIIDYF